MQMPGNTAPRNADRQHPGPGLTRGTQNLRIRMAASAPEDLGTYPLHAIVDMFSFDITTHLRYDIVQPRGPIEVSLRRLDERQLGPAVSWLLAGIPRMQCKLPRSSPDHWAWI
jgi:hypothetical protein